MIRQKRIAIGKNGAIDNYNNNKKKNDHYRAWFLSVSLQPAECWMDVPRLICFVISPQPSAAIDRCGESRMFFTLKTVCKHLLVLPSSGVFFFIFNFWLILKINTKLLCRRIEPVDLRRDVVGGAHTTCVCRAESLEKQFAVRHKLKAILLPSSSTGTALNRLSTY